jgi:peptidoglycan/LPS O-acetylase OafA/YrhL
LPYVEAKKEKVEDGTLLGKFYNICKDRRVRICIEWVGIGIMSFVAFVPRCLQTGCAWPQIVHSFYWGLSKPIFLLGMTMTILPTMVGHSHSFFNLIMTSSAFHFIARISFCTYLVHLMVLYNFIMSRNYNIYYNIIDSFIVYLG